MGDFKMSLTGEALLFFPTRTMESLGFFNASLSIHGASSLSGLSHTHISLKFLQHMVPLSICAENWGELTGGPSFLLSPHREEKP